MTVSSALAPLLLLLLLLSGCCLHHHQTTATAASMDGSSLARRRTTSTTTTSVINGGDNNHNNNNNGMSNVATTHITDYTFKPLILECLAELTTENPTACDGMAHWDVSRVTDCSKLFWDNDDKLMEGAELFNVDLSRWDTRSCTTMRSMFHGASTFHQNIGHWDTSRVQDMAHMFQSANTFNANIGGWDTSRVTDMSHMFRYANQFAPTVLPWDTSQVKQFSYMFLDADQFNGYINDWNVSSASDKSGTTELAFVAMLDGAIAYNQPLDKWKIPPTVQQFSFMFQSALSFNQDLSSWNVEHVTDYTGMLHGAKKFQQTLCWNITNDANIKKDKMLEGSQGTLDSKVQQCLKNKPPPQPTVEAPPVWEPPPPLDRNFDGDTDDDDNSTDSTTTRHHQHRLKWLVVVMLVISMAVLLTRCRVHRRTLNTLRKAAFEGDTVCFDGSTQDLVVFGDATTTTTPNHQRRTGYKDDDPTERKVSGGIDTSNQSAESISLSDLFNRSKSFDNNSSADNHASSSSAAVQQKPTTNNRRPNLLQRSASYRMPQRSHSQRLQRQQLHKTMRTSMRRLRRQRSNVGRTTTTPTTSSGGLIPDYFDDGAGVVEAEISFDSEENTTANEDLFSKSFSGDDLDNNTTTDAVNVEDPTTTTTTDREMMSLENAVASMTAIVQFERQESERYLSITRKEWKNFIDV